MKASLTQRNIKILAQVLTGLQEELAALRKQRKTYNQAADHFTAQANNAGTMEESMEADEQAKDYRHQASLYTPYINKFKRKIAGLEEIQKALKHEIKCVACLEAWIAEDDVEWIEAARLAAEEGYAPQHVVDDFLIQFGSEEE